MSQFLNAKLNSKQLGKLGASAIILGSVFGLGLQTQAQETVSPDQKAALQAVAKMTEGQRTYYQQNGQFRAKIDDLQKDFGITLPKTFDYAVRTTAEAAYSYVIPAQSSMTGQLKAYVGGAFLTPNQEPKITTIICESTTAGQIRPADPQLVRGTFNPNELTLQCGEFSIQIPASEVNE